MMAAAYAANAQTMYDAINFSRNDYYGTARTLGMSNAVTAIGGDLGTLSVNPAGGSVAGYSQFTWSMGLDRASSSAAFAPSYNSATGSQAFGGREFDNSKTRFTIPNVGLNLVFESDDFGSVRAWNFGVVMNRTNTFTNIFSADGDEGHTSLTGYLATQANGMPGDVLGYSDIYDSGYPWNVVAAYDAGLINFNYDAGEYYGSAETKDIVGSKYSYEVLGTLRQKVGCTTLGSKNDLLFNFGANIADRLFLGANLSIPIINYKYSEYYDEAALDPLDFPVTSEYWSRKADSYVTQDPTNYLGSTYQYSYVADITGANLKLGAIWLPTDGLRLGAAIQTPTIYTVHERFYVDASADFSNSNFNASSSTPTAESTYDLVSAWSWNAGVAYTFGRLGMLSIDYEMTDFGHMSYSRTSEDEYYYSDDPYYQVNRLNKLFCGLSHSIRVGAEVRPLPYLSLRAGFSLMTNPEKYYRDTDGYDVYAADYDAFFNEYERGVYKMVKSSARYVSDRRVSFTAGVGYSSKGSFFADLAFKHTSLPDATYKPYGNYIENIVSPTISYTNSLFDAVLTVGWRF